MTWLHVIEGVAGAVVTVVGIYVAILYARSATTKVNIGISKDTIETQGETIAAQAERIDLMDRDLSHERDLNVARSALIESQNARIEHLERIITARDLIEAQGAMMRRAFIHLHVPPTILDAS